MPSFPAARDLEVNLDAMTDIERTGAYVRIRGLEAALWALWDATYDAEKIGSSDGITCYR